MPDNPEHLLVCNRSPSLFIMTLSGMLVQVAQLCRVASRRIASHTASQGTPHRMACVAWCIASRGASRGTASHRAPHRPWRSRVPVQPHTCIHMCMQTFSSGKRTGGDFVQCLVSPQGGWVHCVAEDSHLYSFEIKEGKLQHLLRSNAQSALASRPRTPSRPHQCGHAPPRRPGGWLRAITWARRGDRSPRGCPREVEERG